ncbi:MAG TPA: alpha/beta hydrolase [Rhizomicrobium sp.]|nr:alpha/beta hydrolase [Rhizomicrobium sp.]
MAEFVKTPDGVRIAYEAVGAGETVVLVHGFAASRVQNWKQPGWYETLASAGYRVVAMDCRGHGDSDKPHDPAAYDHAIMAEDVVAVMEASNSAPAFLMGYSMGGFLGIHVLMDHPDMLRKLVIGGVGASYFGRAFGPRDAIADALVVADKSEITDPIQRQFREFAEQSGKDRVALAACMRANRRPFTPGELKRSKKPVMVVCGEYDTLTGEPGPLADAFADGRAVVVPRRDHMTTVGDRVYKQAALDFFRR